ncbi:hypothetical protein ASPCADRAFT_205164 [Aspergillus carbonarius ITEM 5010]|uniref:Uncharacterized protein n=1 Tax=Aspergillus carbonarius (strain ITEM 5010) TaxID=602072 RepID=A0A1R3RTT6_ASPC5|nr:hypothetical protein ASPCADRAFT_205164 [Aspergillus carbonarius ITEM 5010]
MRMLHSFNRLLRSFLVIGLLASVLTSAYLDSFLRGLQSNLLRRTPSGPCRQLPLPTPNNLCPISNDNRKGGLADRGNIETRKFWHQWVRLPCALERHDWNSCDHGGNTISHGKQRYDLGLWGILALNCAGHTAILN